MQRARPARVLVASLLALSMVATSLASPGAAWAQGEKATQGGPKSGAPAKDLLERGKALFEDQQYEESIQTLSAALLRPSNTREQKLSIYRYLALNYITLNRKDEAESAVRGLLALKPDYELPASESPRFRDFFAGTRRRWEADGRPGSQVDAQAAAPVAMAHASPAKSDQHTQIDLEVKITDPQRRVRSVTLFYRRGSEGKFAALDATYDAGEARASIPPDDVAPPVIEYYFEADDAGGLPVVSRGDADAPLRIPIPEKKAWVLPVVVGASVLGAGAVVGALALAGVFNGTPATPPPPPGKGPPKQSTVTVTISSFGQGFRVFQ